MLNVEPLALDVGRSALSVGRYLVDEPSQLCLIAEALLMAILPHALAALVLGNFRFASFF
jgi:hypothetical protein